MTGTAVTARSANEEKKKHPAMCRSHNLPTAHRVEFFATTSAVVALLAMRAVLVALLLKIGT